MELEKANLSPKPFLFSFSNTEILTELQESGTGQIRTLNTSRSKVIPDQEIEIFTKIPVANNDFTFATGIILGKTTKDGVLDVDFSRFTNTENILISRSQGNFGYYYGKFPNFLPKNDIIPQIFDNGNNFSST